MGHHNRHFGNDPRVNAGVWSPPTSTANFCEEDYAITLFIAEFINTLTNLTYIWLGLRYPNKEKGARPDLMSMALVFLGVKSFLFHCTLRHTMQYCDEFGMLVLAGALLQAVFAIGRSPAATRAITIAIVGAVGALMAVYVSTANILHHVFAFNAMVLLIIIKTLSLIYGVTRPAPEKAALVARAVKTLAVLILAYTLWQIDLEKCLELRRLREAVGLPWAWVFELHGWWHVLTAWGAMEQIKLTRAMMP